MFSERKIGREFSPFTLCPVLQSLRDIFFRCRSLEDFIERAKPAGIPNRIVNLIRTVMASTLGTAREWIGKARHVPACFPDLWVHAYGRVETNHIVAQANVVAPPQTLNVVLE